jgi:hypothetical protein
MVSMSECDFGSIRPFDCLGRPVIFIIVDIRPFRFSPTSILLDSGCHVNTILLFQFFIRQVLLWWRLNSYIDDSQYLCAHLFRQYEHTSIFVPDLIGVWARPAWLRTTCTGLGGGIAHSAGSLRDQARA